MFILVALVHDKTWTVEVRTVGLRIDNSPELHVFVQGYASLDNDAMGGGVGNGMGDGMGNLPDMGMPAPEDVEPSALE